MPLLEAGRDEALGANFTVSIDKRMDGAGEVGTHKPSMLQDLERGRQAGCYRQE